MQHGNQAREQTHASWHSSLVFSPISSASSSNESDAFAAPILTSASQLPLRPHLLIHLMHSRPQRGSSTSRTFAEALLRAPFLTSVSQLPLRPHFLIHLMHSRPQLRQFHFAHFCSSFASSILACGPLDPGRRIFVSGAAQRTRHFEPDPSRISGVGSFSSASSLASSSASGVRTR